MGIYKNKGIIIVYSVQGKTGNGLKQWDGLGGDPGRADGVAGALMAHQILSKDLKTC